jgi:hypothetical protein
MPRTLEGNLGYCSIGSMHRRQGSVGVGKIDVSLVNKSLEQSLQNGEVPQLRKDFTTLWKVEVQRNRSTVIGGL